jgi:cytochrome c oxidase cbb3-type subunit III
MSTPLQEQQQVEPSSVEDSPIDVPLTDHAYDGITEYDNPIPSWWSWLWVGTILFSGVYLVVSIAAPDMKPTSTFVVHEEDDLKRNMGEFLTMNPDQSTLLELQSNTKAIAIGRSLFRSNCISCHGTDGQGIGTAPNLTDNQFIHATTITDLYDIIYSGRNANAMPAQRTKMKPHEILLLTNYVASLRGQNKGGNPPQGTHTIAKW